MLGNGKILIFCVGLFLFLKSPAQSNLVPNHSFENYTSCPSTGGQLPLAIPWTAPTNNSAEYFNTCSTNPYYSVPDQVYNFQEAHFGDAFISGFMYNGPNSNYREYAQVQLLNSLVSGQCYYVEFFTNRATGAYGGKYAVNNIGGLFTDSAITNTGSGFNAFDLIPDVLKFGNAIITDTVNWTQISGIYVANGGEQYITIGNFASDANTDTLDMLDGTYKGAVYFFDDVFVIPIDSISGGMSAYAGVDTNITLGDSVFIGQQISNLNCNWFDSDGVLIASNISGIYVKPTINTYYVVEQNLCGNITYDTVTVTILPTGVEAPKSPKGTFSIYPNPNGGSFTITHLLRNESNVYLEIIDITGKVVHREKVTTTKQLINTPQLSKGLYFLSFKSEAGELMYSTKMSVVR